MKIRKNLIIPYIISSGIVNLMLTSVVAAVVFILSAALHWHISLASYLIGYTIGYIIIFLSGLELIVDITDEDK